MRYLAMLLAMIVLSSGCTSHQLRRSTVQQASTVTDLQYQQVLNNIAMLYANPDAMPFHVKLHDGSAQISDFGNGFVSFNILDSNRLFGAIPGLSASRTVVDQWSHQPVTDDTTLKLLQRAYRRAYGQPLPNEFDSDFKNDLSNELKKQIAVTEDLRQNSRLFYELQLEEARRCPCLLGPDGRAFTDATNAGQSSGPPHAGSSWARFDAATTTTNEYRHPQAFHAAKTDEDCSIEDCSICDTKEPAPIEVSICEANGSCECQYKRGTGDEHAPCAKMERLPALTADHGGMDLCGKEFQPLNIPLVMSTGTTVRWSTSARCTKKGSETSIEPIYVVETCDCCDDENCKMHEHAKPKLDDENREKIDEQVKPRNDCRKCDDRPSVWKPMQFQVLVTRCAPACVTFSVPTGPEGIRFRICRVDYRASGTCQVPNYTQVCTGLVVVTGPLRSPLTVEVCRQIQDVKHDLDSIKPGWFSVGTCKPKNACYVGQFKYCGCWYYAWVNDGGYEDLTTFTLTVLKFADLLKESQVLTIPGGIKFSPSFGLSR